MEPACAIERVSTSRQTPGLQSPPIAAWSVEHDYDLPDQNVFKLKASAKKDNTAHARVLEDVVEGARQGDWTVVIVVAIDRIERHGVFALRGWIHDLMRAGCRVESTSPGEAWLADTHDELMWSIRLDMEADRARREAELRSERTGRGHDRKDELGQGRVRLKLGWKYKQPKVKFEGVILKDRPAQVAVRAAFRAVAAGGTLRDGQRAMAAKGYERSTEQISAIIRSYDYSSGVIYVPSPVEVEPCVRPEIQAAAIRVLSDRVSYTGPRNRETDAEHFGGRIFCRPHQAPLHHWLGPPRKDHTRKRYYRGRRPECDCGLFDAEALDMLTNLVMYAQGQPEYEMRSVGGGDPMAVARLEAEQAKLLKAKPDGWLTTMSELETRLEAAKTGDKHRERVPTGYDMGDVWASFMTQKERRRYLERQAESGNFRVLFWKVPEYDPPYFGLAVTPDGMVVSQGFHGSLEEWDASQRRPLPPRMETYGPTAVNHTGVT